MKFRYAINGAVRENILFGLFTLAIAGVGFVSTTLLANYFSLDEFGRYQFFIVLLGLFSTLSPTGYDNVLRRELLRANWRPLSYYYHNIVPIIIILIMAVALGIYLLRPANADYMLAATLVVFFLVFDKLSSVLSAKVLFKRLRYIDLVSRIAFLCLTVFVATKKISLEQFMIMLVGLHVLNHTSRALLMGRWTDRAPGILSAEERAEFNNTAIRNSLAVVYASLAAWAERLILGWLDPADLAIFTVGYLIPKIIKDNAKSFLTPLFYGWSSQGADHQFAKVREHTGRLLLMGLVVTLALGAVSYIGITVFFEKYKASILISLVLSLSILPIFLVYGMAHATLMSNHISVNNRVEFVASTVKLVSAVILVPLYSIWGAVICIMVSEAFRLTFYIVSFNRVVKNIPMRTSKTPPSAQ